MPELRSWLRYVLAMGQLATVCPRLPVYTQRWRSAFKGLARPCKKRASTRETSSTLTVIAMTSIQFAQRETSGKILEVKVFTGGGGDM